MSTVTLDPRRTGATAAPGHPHNRAWEALHAVKVFAQAAFGVVVLGEYAEEAGVRRR
ncbi:hypothetical protein ACIOEZ_00820 [Streptomyces sp. NPDC087866]|uniref:hypothetical protein n=1 Tax=Streptomyces TaxID=1883 RepID=UPI00036A4545|nr:MULTISPECIES: hypothetical protein [unclassified Streptomyces]WSX92443.1 hypothetical protein OH827_18775 [Streptomyces sp. NBC_00891]WSY06920.1 hypothetical protein OG464_18775 [Streptomyces sp. NBC_00890]WSZ08546.1 hypothetical protein OG704_18775 [Streptomyces sp. NBC_00869]WSZ23955.1 hypothetical protein OG498_14790 [Streptomyces sp. NBC_00870]MCX4447695.1 hypothetical protein [Streptomyces sp. NBC_01789]